MAAQRSVTRRGLIGGAAAVGASAALPGAAGATTWRTRRVDVKLTFDNSPPQGAPGVLLGFIEGEEARRWTPRSKAKRRAAVLECFARYFGDRARRPRAYVEQDWATQEWTRGCYVGYTPPGVLLDYGPAIRRPVGAIHWAGAEYATTWNGYMDGAVRSGEATATEVLRAL